MSSCWDNVNVFGWNDMNATLKIYVELWHKFHHIFTYPILLKLLSQIVTDWFCVCLSGWAGQLISTQFYIKYSHTFISVAISHIWQKHCIITDRVEPLQETHSGSYIDLQQFVILHKGSKIFWLSYSIHYFTQVLPKS